MAPRQWATETYQLIHDCLVVVHGDHCAVCHATPTEPLAIDHIDRNRKNRNFTNLRLLCRTCNNQNRSLRGINESERVRQLKLGETISPTETAKQDLPYANGSAEMKASTYFELIYRNWVIENAPMERNDAINAGAETVGCNVQTATRYLAKLTSKAGPLAVIQDTQGRYTITRKEAT